MAEREHRKEQLRAELDRARSALSTRASAVGEALDFKSRIRKSVGRNAVAWIGGAVLLGFVLSRLPRRKAKVRVKVPNDDVDAGTVAKAGLGMAVAKMAFDVARPTLVKVAMNQLQPIIERVMERWRTRG
jgi:hypothetical protein